MVWALEGVVVVFQDKDARSVESWRQCDVGGPPRIALRHAARHEVDGPYGSRSGMVTVKPGGCGGDAVPHRRLVGGA